MMKTLHKIFWAITIVTALTLLTQKNHVIKLLLSPPMAIDCKVSIIDMLPADYDRLLIEHSVNIDLRQTKEQDILQETPCFNNTYSLYQGHFLDDKCWGKIRRGNQMGAKTLSPVDVLCAFEPISPRPVKRVKRTVVLGIGVHLGPSVNENTSVPCAGFEYLSWEPSSKKIHSNFTKLLFARYSPQHLRDAQRAFWDGFRYDKDLLRTDIIVCGFDSWHCLIFAPFNKKLIFNHVYRFDGHRAPLPDDVKQFQTVMYEAVRYNPDVILAGGNVYDVIYAQHFLGSHKIIPLLADCEYVHPKVAREIAAGDCAGVPNTTCGYHPMNKTIAIFPKRLSRGGRVVANQAISYLRAHGVEYDLFVAESVRKRFNYCELGVYPAVIMFPYSVMSYFCCESASLGIPMFMPSPRLYAEWERDYHVVEERKGVLAHRVIDDMKQNKRSLNYGYQPNNDFDLRSLERWLGYAEMYYQGATTFDSFEQLRHKIKEADFVAMNKRLKRHRVDNVIRTRLHWNSVERYFYGTGFEAARDYATPATFEEGMKMWERKCKRPLYDENHDLKMAKEDQKTWVILERNNSITSCEQAQGYKFALFDFDQKSTNSQVKGCENVRLKDIQKHEHLNLLTHLVFARNPGWQENASLKRLLMLLYAQQRGATSIVLLTKRKATHKKCALKNEFKHMVRDSNAWMQSEYAREDYWIAWLPLSEQILDIWVQRMSKYIKVTACTTCKLFHEDGIESFTANEMGYLKSYLQSWDTDEHSLFPHVLDQNLFELAVKGFAKKLDVELYREYLKQLARFGITWYISPEFI